MPAFSTQEYIETLKFAVENGQEASMVITGNSMSPFLCHERDVIYFKAPNAPLKKGDMVFFKRQNGQFVMHRLWKKKQGGWFIIGDNQSEAEGPISEEQIFAKVVRVKRKDHIIGPHHFLWFIFAHIWIHLIPFRRMIIRCYQMLPFS